MRERLGGRDGHGTGQVRHTVVTNAVHGIDRVVVRSGPSGLEAPALVHGHVHEQRVGLDDRQVLPAHELGRRGARDQDGTHDHVRARQFLLHPVGVAHEDPGVGEQLVELAQAIAVGLEDRDVRAGTHGRAGRVFTHGATADHQHGGRNHAGNPAQEDPGAARVVLEVVRGVGDRQAARDLGHRAQQGQRAPHPNGLVGDSRGAAVQQRFRQRTARGQVEVREQCEVRAQEVVLGGDRLLDLHQQLGLRPRVLLGRDPRSRRTVGIVRETRTLPRVLCDEHLVVFGDQCGDHGGGEAHAGLFRFDLTGCGDSHDGALLSWGTRTRGGVLGSGDGPRLSSHCALRHPHRHRGRGRI